VDDSEAFVLGNVHEGLDAKKLHRTMELRRHFGDCGNCTAIKTCNLCYARVPYADRAEAGYDPHYDALCQQTRAANESMLRTYTEIMEQNPKAFDKPYEIKFPRIRYGVFPRPLAPEMLEKLECESIE
jgi:sulfatase maturation enzyme AslB (radical SAM superfamily)